MNLKQNFWNYLIHAVYICDQNHFLLVTLHLIVLAMGTAGSICNLAPNLKQAGQGKVTGAYHKFVSA